MQINKLRLIGKVPEDPAEFLRCFDCEIYLNDSETPADNIKSIEIIGDSTFTQQGKPELVVKLEMYLNELEVELPNPKVDIKQAVVKEGIAKKRIGYRIPLMEEDSNES